MIIKYPVLCGKIAERGISKISIAQAINASPKTLYNKMTGATSFTWEEVNVIRERFFPDESLKDLFTPTA